MATAASAAPPTVGPEGGKRAERRFFSIYLTLLALVILAGFVPSFFLRGLIESPRPLPPLRPELLVHGVIGTAFVLFFPFQAWLISSGRRQLHMKTGKWGFVLGAALLATLYVVALTDYRIVAAGGFPGVPPAAAPAAGGSVLLAIPALALLLWLAWRKRFDAQAHKRLITGIAWSASMPGLGRLLGWIEAPQSPLVTLVAVPLLLFGPLWIWDIALRRRPHWATLLGTGVMVGTFVLRPVIMGLPTWPAIIAALPGFGWP